MKVRIFNAAFLAAVITLAAFLLLTGNGCAATAAKDPTVIADNAALTQIDAKIDALNRQIAVASTQPAATQPSIVVQVPGATTQPADTTPLLTQLQLQLADLKSQQAATLAQIAADTAANKQAQAAQATSIAQAVAAVLPGPWGTIVGSIAGIIGIGAVSYFGKNMVSAQAQAHADSNAAVSENHANALQGAVTAAVNAVPAAVNQIMGALTPKAVVTIDPTPKT